MFTTNYVELRHFLAVKCSRKWRHFARFYSVKSRLDISSFKQICRIFISLHLGNEHAKEAHLVVTMNVISKDDGHRACLRFHLNTFKPVWGDTVSERDYQPLPDLALSKHLFELLQ